MKIKNRYKIYTQEDADRFLGFTNEDIKEVENMSLLYRHLVELRKIRKESGLTQSELSKGVGVPRAAISKIENGQRNVTIETLAKVATGLGKRVKIVFF